MTRSRAGRKCPVLILTGPQGMGKSRLAYEATKVANSDLIFVPWHSTKPLRTPRDNWLYRPLGDRTRYQADEIVYECETPSGLHALLKSSLDHAITTHVGLIVAPPPGARQVLEVGYAGYVMYVRATGQKRRPAPLNPGWPEDDPVKIGLRVDEDCLNDFGPGGLTKSCLRIQNLAYVLRRGA